MSAPRAMLERPLLLDEAHHALTDGLSQVVSLWRERSEQLFFFTVTLYCGDGRSDAPLRH